MVYHKAIILIVTIVLLKWSLREKIIIKLQALRHLTMPEKGSTIDEDDKEPMTRGGP